MADVKLLIYSHFFAPSIGGVETIVRTLASGLCQLRSETGPAQFDVTVVTETPSNGLDDRVFPFRVIRNPGIWGLLRLVWGCNVVHVAGPALLPMAISILLRKPVVVEHHGFQTICPNGQLLIEPANEPCPGHFMAGNHQKCLSCTASFGWVQSRKLWLLTFVRRFLCRCVSQNIAPTAWLATMLDLPRTRTIWHGIETQTVHPNDSEKEHKRPCIVFQGRLVTTKGIRVLVEAARLLRDQRHDFEILIIGEGPERFSLEQSLTSSELRSCLRFAGRLSDSEVVTAIASAFAVVVPSLGGEVFGLVVAENMRRGLPVVASDLGAFREILGDDGLLFRTGDPADLASKLKFLLDNPALSSALAQRAQRRYQLCFALRPMIEKHADMYAEIGG
jgi:glycogen(starch) synthase